MRVLILGGDGYLGWPTAMHLSSAGHEVVVLDNLSTGRKSNLDDLLEHPQLRFVSGSITDPLAVAEAAPSAPAGRRSCVGVGSRRDRTA